MTDQEKLLRRLVAEQLIAMDEFVFSMSMSDEESFNLFANLYFIMLGYLFKFKIGAKYDQHKVDVAIEVIDISMRIKLKDLYDIGDPRNVKV